MWIHFNPSHIKIGHLSWGRLPSEYSQLARQGTPQHKERGEVTPAIMKVEVKRPE